MTLLINQQSSKRSKNVILPNINHMHGAVPVAVCLFHN